MAPHLFEKASANLKGCSMTPGKPPGEAGRMDNSTLVLFFSNNEDSRGYGHVQYALKQNTAW